VDRGCRRGRIRTEIVRKQPKFGLDQSRVRGGLRREVGDDMTGGSHLSVSQRGEKMGWRGGLVRTGFGLALGRFGARGAGGKKRAGSVGPTR
jgi:hypothetical protein